MEKPKMEEMKKSTLIKYIINALYNVASRRTTNKFADETIGSSIKTLERKFDFLSSVSISKKDLTSGGYAVTVSPDIEEVHTSRLGKAIESLIRVVYNDLSDDAGLYFVTEFKEIAGETVLRKLKGMEIDLDEVQLEQHYAFRRRERKKEIETAAKTGKLSRQRPENLLGYTWGNVSSWRHEPGSKYCVLYDKEGKVLDRLNLDRIIQNYVEKLSGYTDVDVREIEKEAQVYEKEYKLLQLMLERDMDAETAQHMLKISKEELNNMIKKLSEMEMLHFINFDTLEITETGIDYLTKKNDIKRKK
jgi:hypothetical protein